MDGRTACMDAERPTMRVCVHDRVAMVACSIKHPLSLPMRPKGAPVRRVLFVCRVSDRKPPTQEKKLPPPEIYHYCLLTTTITITTGLKKLKFGRSTYTLAHPKSNGMFNGGFMLPWTPTFQVCRPVPSSVLHDCRPKMVSIVGR